MPGAGFTTFTAGSVLTATQVNTYLMQQAVMVFTNEAARDAAITAPSEGMIAYLTSPTVPAASGTTTYLPTGVKTIYNGTVWVCVTEVSAYTSATGTTTSTTATLTLSGSPGTNPSVTLVTGTTALIHIGGYVANNTLNAAAYLMCGVASGTSPGTGASSFDTAVWAELAANSGINASRSFVVGGLTAGTNTFALTYAVSSGTGNFARRTLTVKGIA